MPGSCGRARGDFHEHRVTVQSVGPAHDELEIVKSNPRSSRVLRRALIKKRESGWLKRIACEFAHEADSVSHTGK